jgi:hypothetical protein
MAYQNNKQLLHRKEWQMMSPVPTATAAGAFITKDPLGIRRTALYVAGTTTQQLYDVNEDSWQVLSSFAMAGTFGAGACGGWGLWSNTLTTNGGSTTTLTLATNISGKNLVGKTIWVLTGAAGNVGIRRTVSAVDINPGGTSTITVSVAFPAAIVTGNTFKVDTGVYYVLNAYTAVAAGVFKSYDVITGVVTTLGTTGLPAAWASDGRLISTPSYSGVYVSGTATAGAATTLTDSTKSFTVNGIANYQIRITAGTGIGQVRTIASNTATVITVSAAWTTNPDATSQYAIEGNDDYLYLMGNGAVTMYRYSISANTFTTLAPTAARAAAPGIGMSGNWVAKTGDPLWAASSTLEDGRYIYSFRGAGTADLHRYDIALNTWQTITYIRTGETFTTGSSFDVDGGRIYGMVSSTGRFLYYEIVVNELVPFSIDFYGQSTAVIGDKMFTVTYDDETGGDNIDWIYYLGNSTTALRRLMIY